MGTVQPIVPRMAKKQRLKEKVNDTQIWPTEPRMYIDENSVPHNEKAERLNGRMAMMGVIAAIGSYAVTGQLIPGIW